jgi:hypothetical protein
MLGVLLATALAGAPSDDACWRLAYAAIQHNAAAPHAAYISYSETVNVFADRRRVEYDSIDVTYRDDGLAYINDDRWGRAFLSGQLEPGPPVLGPYGDSRESWLPAGLTADGFLTIAQVENPELRGCTDLGDDTIRGTGYAHLAFGPASGTALKAMWVDRRTGEAVRLVVSGLLYYHDVDAKLAHTVVDYQIDMQSINGYAVLQAARWSYVLRSYSQWSRIDAEYDFGNYRFATTQPPGTDFSTTT